MCFLYADGTSLGSRSPRICTAKTKTKTILRTATSSFIFIFILYTSSIGTFLFTFPLRRRRSYICGLTPEIVRLDWHRVYSLLIVLPVEAAGLAQESTCSFGESLSLKDQNSQRNTLRAAGASFSRARSCTSIALGSFSSVASPLAFVFVLNRMYPSKPIVQHVKMIMSGNR